MLVETASGMDLLDLFSFFPGEAPGSATRRLSLQENIAGALGLCVFPVLDFFIVLFAELYKDPTLAAVLLPGAFASVSLILCGLLRISTGWTFAISVGCLGLCVAASMAALLLGLFASFFSAF